VATPDAGSNAAEALRIAVGRIAHRLRQLWATGEMRDGISFTEGAILTHLVRAGASSPTGLAGTERVTSQAIAAHLANLEERGLICRSADPDDRRKVIVTITRAGSAALADRENILMRHLAHALESFDEADLRTLAAAGPLLVQLADQL
jgi:DNA-binding MarR family transcriptional regulator